MVCTFTDVLLTLNTPHKFISADPSSTQIGEPLLDDIAKYIDYDAINWIIIGSLNCHGSPVPAEKACPRQRTENGTRKEWVLSLIELANKHHTPVFIKDALYRLYPDIPQRKNLPYLSSIPIGDKSNL